MNYNLIYLITEYSNEKTKLKLKMMNKYLYNLITVDIEELKIRNALDFFNEKEEELRSLKEIMSKKFYSLNKHKNRRIELILETIKDANIENPFENQIKECHIVDESEGVECGRIVEGFLIVLDNLIVKNIYYHRETQNTEFHSDSITYLSVVFTNGSSIKIDLPKTRDNFNITNDDKINNFLYKLPDALDEIIFDETMNVRDYGICKNYCSVRGNGIDKYIDE